jgi:catechol 2,3-dioxygenase-like lactoylglutathione lyase family enzyme
MCTPVPQLPMRVDHRADTKEQSMRADRILETCLYVDDLNAAEAFYQDVLGLEQVVKSEGRHVFFRCGQGMFLLFNPDRTEVRTGRAPTHGSRGQGHAAFAMAENDIEGWRSYLEEKGIEIEAEVSWPGGGSSLYFRDPAGNSLELTTPMTWGL